jgi:hypothetical protein
VAPGIYDIGSGRGGYADSTSAGDERHRGGGSELALRPDLGLSGPDLG